MLNNYDFIGNFIYLISSPNTTNYWINLLKIPFQFPLFTLIFGLIVIKLSLYFLKLFRKGVI